MKTYILERRQVITRSRAETFAFFSNPLNLERITPPFLRFRMLTKGPIEIRPGTLIDYRIELFGVAVYWKTVIAEWAPDAVFADIQLKGPYAFWRHTHLFFELDSDHTLMQDRVEYRVPYGWLGRIANLVFVGRTLKKIFDYRAEMIARALAASSASQATP